MLSHFDNEQTEDYFRRFNAQLGKMPRQERAELHMELRQHLEGLVAAHEELGASPKEALEAALRQFGEPKSIGRRMYREWRRAGEPRRTGLCLPAALYAVAWIMGLEAVSFSAMAHGLPRGVFGGLTELGSGLTALVLAPLVAGGLTGWKFRERAIPGVFYATLPFAALLALAHDSHLSWYNLAGLCWSPLSSVCAYAVSAVRLGRCYRPAWTDLLLRLR